MLGIFIHIYIVYLIFKGLNFNFMYLSHTISIWKKSFKGLTQNGHSGLRFYLSKPVEIVYISKMFQLRL
jgi:hypothetical protein